MAGQEDPRPTGPVPSARGRLSAVDDDIRPREQRAVSRYASITTHASDVPACPSPASMASMSMRREATVDLQVLDSLMTIYEALFERGQRAHLEAVRVAMAHAEPGLDALTAGLEASGRWSRRARVSRPAGESLTGQPVGVGAGRSTGQTGRKNTLDSHPCRSLVTGADAIGSFGGFRIRWDQKRSTRRVGTLPIHAPVCVTSRPGR